MAIAPKLVKSQEDLPPIPARRYFTIGEASELCGVEPHVLRYWEEEFSQIQPARRKRRRYYQRADILSIRHIRRLLYEEGYTIDGARRLISGERRGPAATPAKEVVQDIIRDLEGLQRLLR